MTDHRWMGLGTALACGLLAAWPASAQLRPMARPSDLAMPSPEEVVTPASAIVAPTVPPGPDVGPETNLPLPRFVSLKTGEGNARRGPGLDHRIDWVFVREDMPLLLTAEYDNWRRVEDRDGMGGWIHYSLLSGNRTVIVDQNLMPLRVRPEDGAPEAALLEAGVVARVESCDADWCRLSAGGYDGWARKAGFWGVGPAEVLD